MEPSSEASEDVDPNELKFARDGESEPSDSDSEDPDGASDPSSLLDEPEQDFTLDLMSNLYEEQPDVETYSKYSEMLFGVPGGSSSSCPHCEFTSENLLELRIHMSKSHDGLKVYCIQCDYSAARRDTLLVHVRKVHEGRGFPCDRCNYIAGTRQHLERHVRTIHQGFKRTSTPKKKSDFEDDVLWPCDFCDYKTKRRYELKSHFAAEHEGKRFSCELCDFSAKRRDKLNLHIKVVHEGLGKKCDYCDYKAGTNQHLLRHLRSKHADVEGADIEMLKCKECGEEFSRQERLNEHFKREHQHVAREVEAESSEESQVRKTKYRCPQSDCHFSAGRKGKVTEHVRVVHGGKKFQCDQCDFNCLTHGGLYLHQKAVHLGIRFKCNQCNYEGTQEVNLKRHIESKHGTIQYCCKLCNAKTKGLWYIETHLKKVHGILDKSEYGNYLVKKEIDPAGWGSTKSNVSENSQDEYSLADEDDENDTGDTSFDPSDLLDQSAADSPDSPFDPSELLDQSSLDLRHDVSSLLEPRVEISFDDEDEDDDIPDLELFEPNVEINFNEEEGNEETAEEKRKHPKLTCKKCGFVANSSGTLTRHVNVVHRGVRWSCKLCGYVTNVKCSMIRHIQSIHMGWRYQCPFCDHEATQKGGLKYHIEKRHPLRLPIANWSSLEPVKSTATSQVAGLENMDITAMYDEVQEAIGDNLTEEEESHIDHEDADDTSMLEPTVQIMEEGNEETNEEDLAGELETDGTSQYVGEDHDFSELFAKFNTNGEEEVQCDLCTYVTSRVGNMRRHVSASHQGIRFPCDQCSYRAPDKGSLMRHTRGVHEGIKFYCDFCSYSASQKGNLKKHVEMKHPDKEYSCPYCDFKVNWKGSFIKHMQNLHGDLMSIQGLSSNGIAHPLLSFNTSLNSTTESPNISKDLSGLEPVDTEEPPKKIAVVTTTTDKLKTQNMDSVDKELEQSKVIVSEERIVISPTSSVANNLNPDACFDPENMTFDCPLCDFKAQSSASLARHNAAIHRGIRWKCKDCDFITRDKSSLKRHRRNRHDGIRFQCNYCDYDAGQKGNIKSHMDRRHPEIPYDHTEFQQVRVEKSKYSREPKQQDGGVEMKVLQDINNLNPFNVHMLSTLLQARLANSSAEEDTRDDEDEGGIRIVTANDCDDSYDDIAETDEEDQDERSGSLSTSPAPSNKDIFQDKKDNSILLSALQSIPDNLASPTLTPRKSLLDLASSSNLLESLKQTKMSPKSPSNKSKRYNHGSPVVNTEYDPEATIPCQECEFMARSQGTLFRHIQSVHRGVRYYCKLCDFVTIDKGSLKRHVNGQHEGIKHKCDFCDYENAQIGNVKKHIETKHQNIVYQCPYCELKAKHKWYLEQHVKKIHLESYEEFDIKAVVPSVDNSVSLQSKKLSSKNLFLDMFGHHPMAQFFVPDANKTGGGDDENAENDLGEPEPSAPKF